jgi:hypothetical protein
MKGSTNRMDDGKVLWMTLRGGWHDGNAPDYAVAWCRIPDYSPPVPTPEDKERVAFERWATAELEDDLSCHTAGQYVYQSVRCAWAAWQAAREDAGTPEPVEPSQEDIDRAEFTADTRRQLAQANDRIAVLLVACHLAAQHHQGSSSIPGRALRAAIAMAERGES